MPHTAGDSQRRNVRRDKGVNYLITKRVKEIEREKDRVKEREIESNKYIQREIERESQKLRQKE